MGLLENIKEYRATKTIKNKNSSAYYKFIELGFPSVKNEEWKYTSLKKIISNDFEIEQAGEKISEDEIKDSSLNLGEKLIFLNGELYHKPIIPGS